MGKIVTVPLPQDLPENWTDTQYVSPTGTEVGLTPQHGYNYLMQQVNRAQKAIQELDENAASPGVVDGGATITQGNQLSSTILGFIDTLSDLQSGIFYLICNTDGAQLERGTWFLTINRVSSALSTVWATSAAPPTTSGGMKIRTCSIYSGTVKQWRIIDEDGIVPAVLE